MMSLSMTQGLFYTVCVCLEPTSQTPEPITIKLCLHIVCHGSTTILFTYFLKFKINMVVKGAVITLKPCKIWSIIYVDLKIHNVLVFTIKPL